jgi:hypothetical protein
MMPCHYLFDGKVGGFTKDKPMTARVAETVRLYIGVHGPNKSSTFYVIGEICNRIYDLSGVRAVTEDVQTVTVAPGRRDRRRDLRGAWHVCRRRPRPQPCGEGPDRVYRRRWGCGCDGLLRAAGR